MDLNNEDNDEIQDEFRVQFTLMMEKMTEFSSFISSITDLNPSNSELEQDVGDGGDVEGEAGIEPVPPEPTQTIIARLKSSAARMEELKSFLTSPHVQSFVGIGPMNLQLQQEVGDEDASEGEEDDIEPVPPEPPQTDSEDDEGEEAEIEPVLPPETVIARVKSAAARIWNYTSEKCDSGLLWIMRSRKWVRHGFWIFRKLVGLTLKIAYALVLLFIVVSFSTSMIWDFRLLEPKFLGLTEGVLAPKYMKAIRQWQLAVNQLAFHLDPKYPINKFEEESIWTKFSS